MNIETLICDWSGVISDDLATVVWANNQIRKMYSLPELDKRSFCEQFGRWFEGIEADREILNAKYKHFFNNSPIRPAIIPGSKEALQKFYENGVNIVIFSSHPQIFLDSEAEEYQVKKYIRLLKGSVRNKTELIFDFVANLKSNKSKIAYVGDTIVDIECAKRVKVTAVAVDSGYHGSLVYGNSNKLLQARPDIFALDLKSFYDHHFTH